VILHPNTPDYISPALTAKSTGSREKRVTNSESDGPINETPVSYETLHNYSLQIDGAYRSVTNDHLMGEQSDRDRRYDSHCESVLSDEKTDDKCEAYE